MNQPLLMARPIGKDLLAWYLRNGLPDRLSEAVVVCRYLEMLLADIPPSFTGRLKPVFDHDLDILRSDWHAVRRIDLWRDTVSGEITDTPPPGDGEPIPDTMEHLTEATQRLVLFNRYAHLFA